MTNAEKYLKDGVSAREFIEALEKYGADTNEIKTFLIEQATPTLTEDERIILRNIKLYVGRRINGELFFTFENRKEPYIKGELFQFIKERRRIFNRGAVKMSELLVLIVLSANMVFALIYHFKQDYQKATYHLLWVILMFLVIHNIVNAG